MGAGRGLGVGGWGGGWCGVTLPLNMMLYLNVLYNTKT